MSEQEPTQAQSRVEDRARQRQHCLGAFAGALKQEQGHRDTRCSWHPMPGGASPQFRV